MPKPACHECKRFYRCTKSGIFVLEQMPSDNALPGTSEEGKWGPYKIWQADLWRCHGCGKELISGFGQVPVAEHYQPDFADYMPMVKYTINDC